MARPAGEFETKRKQWIIRLQILWVAAPLPTPHSPIRSPSAHRRGSAFADDSDYCRLALTAGDRKKESCTTPSELSAIRKVSRNGLRGESKPGPGVLTPHFLQADFGPA